RRTAPSRRPRGQGRLRAGEQGDRVPRNPGRTVPRSPSPARAVDPARDAVRRVGAPDGPEAAEADRGDPFGGREAARDGGASGGGGRARRSDPRREGAGALARGGAGV